MKKNRILVIALFVLPCLFFLTAYLLMSMSGEDVAQSIISREKGSFPGLIGWVYSYIPRIGEFITWPVSTVLTYQVSFGIDLLVRVIDAIAVLGVVYLISYLSLRRRLSLRLLDAGVFNLVFVLLILIPQFVSPFFGNPFLSGFSFIHNYVVMSLIAILFVIPFVAPLLHIKSEFRILKNPFVMFVLGFLFAISTELLPISFICTGVLYVLYRKLVVHEKIVVQKWQVFSIIGILVGLAFFYLGGGLSARTGFTYAETYDYISLSSFFKTPKHFLWTFLMHFVKNIKYLLPVFIFETLAMVTYKVRGKKVDGMLALLSLTCVFSLIYVIGTSLIALDDAIASRFLLPCYLLLILSVGIYVTDFYRQMLDSKIKRYVVGLLLLLLTMIIYGDMLVGKIEYFTRTNMQLASIREKTEQNASNVVCLGKSWASEDAGPIYSPIFNFTQEPIFEPWNVKKIYNHDINWVEGVVQQSCD